MNELKFSVVIPSHHRPDFLKRLIDALEKQSIGLPFFEVLVILSPNDLSLSWLSSYQGALKLSYEVPQEDIYNGKNVSFKRNYGAKKAKADWIAFTDDDCLPHVDWLTEADKYRLNSDVGGIEGKTLVPEDSPKTLTWKGLKRLSLPSGYQTCNIFYRKSFFDNKVKFDSKSFPWFLEDTDMAWSVLDSGKTIIFDDKCVVYHPVGPRATWRLIHEAKGAGLKVKLFERHPKLYKSKGMKALRWSQYIYSFLLLAILLGCLWSLECAIFFALALILIHAIHMIKLFKGLKFSFMELMEVSWRTIVSAPLTLMSIVVSLLKSPIRLKEKIFILKP